MNKIIDALKLAEEALIKANHFHDYEDELAAIREALAEQEKQEPVAWATKISKAFFNSPANGVFQVSHLMRDKYSVPLYAAPVSTKREWVDLTCQEVTALIMEGAAGGGWQGFAERVQAAFREKNNG